MSIVLAITKSCESKTALITYIIHPPSPNTYHSDLPEPWRTSFKMFPSLPVLDS